MTRVWNWIKTKAIWILGGIAVVFGIIFAVKHERQKIDSLKRQARAYTLDRAYAVSKEKRVVLDAQEEALHAQDAEIVAELTKDKTEYIKKEVEDRDAKDIAARFNKLYGPDD